MLRNFMISVCRMILQDVVENVRKVQKVSNLVNGLSDWYMWSHFQFLGQLLPL